MCPGKLANRSDAESDSAYSIAENGDRGGEAAVGAALHYPGVSRAYNIDIYVGAERGMPDYELVALLGYAIKATNASCVITVRSRVKWRV